MNKGLSIHGPRLLASSTLLALLAGCASNPEPRRPSRNAYRMKLNSLPEAQDNHALTLTGGPDAFWKDLRTAKGLPSPVAELTLKVVDPKTGAPSPHAILGEYRLEQRRLLFLPSFPLSADARYHAEFFSRRTTKNGSSSIRIAQSLFLPKRPTPATPAIEAIYPSAEIVPENQLKFYLLFSKPMRQGDVFKRLKLFDRTGGAEVSDPFRKVELWSPDGKRLTLWIHPGRQKTGVNLNEEIGPVLQSGHRYELVIAGEWESVDGARLGRDVKKRFKAGPPAKKRVSEDRWTVIPPPTGTRTPLRIVFPSPMDWALLHSQLRVEAEGGKRINGNIETASNETEWRITPREAWPPGDHQIVVDTRLEDLAGNNLRQPFEVDINARPEAMTVTVSIEFQPTPKP